MFSPPVVPAGFPAPMLVRGSPPGMYPPSPVYAVHPPRLPHRMPVAVRPAGPVMAPAGRPTSWRQIQERLAEQSRNMRMNISLQAGGVVTLYHQTSEEAANQIIKQQKMLRGSDGAAGGGMYFATSPAETERKAHKKGVILECLVNLGNVAVMHKHYNMRKVDFRTIISCGVDSIKIIGMPSGVEYVVYNYDQVLKIRKLRRRR